MNAKSVHEMTTDELNQELGKLKSQLFSLRFSHATGQLANPILLSDTKRDIARVLTVIRERELKIEKKSSKGAKA